MSPNRLTLAIVAGLAVALSGCGSDDDGKQLPIAVLTAFPAELQPLVDQMDIDATVTIGNRNIRVGTLAGVPVIVGMTGIGLKNAEATTRAVLDAFDVAGVVMSGVAGSPFRIGDVTVPGAWTLVGVATYDVDRTWLKTAEKLAAAASVEFDTCTERPAAPTAPEVCLLHEPEIVPGGVGESSDPFGTAPAPCQQNGGDVFGCDVMFPPLSPLIPLAAGAVAGVEGGEEEEPTAVDMETAAVAREAQLRGLPFIAFRAVSDGEGDPLNLPGFPAQFFMYYRLAARNAAAATVAFLERLDH